MSRDLDFTPYTVARFPLPDRDARVWDKTDRDPGTTYGAYALQLAKGERGEPVILVEHGGGREIVPLGHGGKASLREQAFQTLAAIEDDRALFAVLFTLYDARSKAERAAREETAQRYGKAFLEGRMKKRRKGGFITLQIEMGYHPALNGVEIDGLPTFKDMDEAMKAAKGVAVARGLPETAATVKGYA